MYLNHLYSRAAGHDVFVYRGDGFNEFIPDKCDFYSLREYNVSGMRGLYNCVIPYKYVLRVFVRRQHC